MRLCGSLEREAALLICLGGQLGFDWGSPSPTPRKSSFVVKGYAGSQAAAKNREVRVLSELTLALGFSWKRLQILSLETRDC